MNIQRSIAPIFCLTVFIVGLGTVKADELTVEFADSAWDGVTIPEGQHCKKFGGKGATPPLTVNNIPAQANAIVVEFNDLDFQPLSKKGGHGRVGFEIEMGAGTAQLPAVPGGTKKMPDGVWLVKKNRATGGWRSPGYLPPCSGGQGNTYVADVLAVEKTSKKKYKVLSKARIVMGSY